jgi:hypothetical protein
MAKNKTHQSGDKSAKAVKRALKLRGALNVSNPTAGQLKEAAAAAIDANGEKKKPKRRKSMKIRKDGSAGLTKMSYAQIMELSLAQSSRLDYYHLLFHYYRPDLCHLPLQNDLTETTTSDI